MAIINRLSRLFRADMHEVLDRLEQPDVLLRQSIREMEESLSFAAQQIQLREAEHIKLEQRQASINVELSKIIAEIELCFQLNNLALARILLRKKLEQEKLSALLQQAEANLKAALNRDKKTWEEQQGRLESLKQKAETLALLAERDSLSATREESISVTDAEIELALLREQQKRSQSC